MRTLTSAGTLLTALLIFAAHALAQTLTTLATFTSAPSDGIGPSGVVIGSGGVLYGATQSGGNTNNGTVFSLTPPASPGGAWTEAVLYNFTGGADGKSPVGVAVGSGGVLYGATSYGGSVTDICENGCGTVFSLTPPASPGGAWTESVLHSFSGGSDGSVPTVGVVIGNDGVLYGTTSNGGTANTGTVFSLTPPQSAGGVWTEAVIYSFTGGVNQSPNPTGLVIGLGGVLYGATRTGGIEAGSICSPFGCGTVFSLTPPKTGSGSAWTEAALYNFTGGSDGSGPSGVAIGNGGVLYGTTAGTNSNTVFSLTPPSGTGNWTDSVLHSFTDLYDLSGLYSGVVVGSGGVLYGTAAAASNGGVFSLTPPVGLGGAWTESDLSGLGGSQPFGGVVIGKGGVLYGATAPGGPGYAGTVFSLTPPQSANAYWTESVLYAFTGGSPGIGVLSGVVVGNGGVLYGTTEGGGTGSCPTGCGTVFSLTPPLTGPLGPGAWTANVLYRFTGGSDGAYPVAGVTIGGNGVLYGTAEYGGTGVCPWEPPGCGVVFSLTPPASPGGAWIETTLHSFTDAVFTCNPIGCGGFDGFHPTTGLAIGSGGMLYGTTGSGGGGTLFSLTPPRVASGTWVESLLYDFAALSDYTISAGPSGLAIGADGTLYGTTAVGGNGIGSSYCPEGCGTVFSLTPPAGGLSTLYNFIPGNGNATNPTAGVVIGSGPGGSAVLYGTTLQGSYQGAVFSLTPPLSPGGDWTEAVLYNFPGPSYAGYGGPSGVVSGSGGVLFGTTPFGGSGPCIVNGNNGCGTVFALIPPPSPGGVWSEATLYNFTGGSDGAFPRAGVVVGGSGVLYGTTQATNTGTVFALTVGSGLAPSINLGGVVNAASDTAPVAPGSIASAFGNFFLSSPLSATQSPLPDEISGLSLQFGGGIQAPLFYASSTQVNFQVPWEVANPSTLTATLDSTASAAQTVNAASAAPAIFSINASGSGQGAILDTSYRLVDSTNPVAAGSYVLIYCTGLGEVSNQPATGSPAASDPLAWSATPTVTIGGAAADVQFSGLAPGYVGLYQVNAKVPAGSTTGSAVPVVISMGGVTSNTVTMAVQ